MEGLGSGESSVASCRASGQPEPSLHPWAWMAGARDACPLTDSRPFLSEAPGTLASQVQGAAVISQDGQVKQSEL